MANTVVKDALRDRLKGFLIYLKREMLVGGTDMERMSQLRRMSDLRIRQFIVGKSQVTGIDLCGLLADGKSGRFDALASSEKLLNPAHLTLAFEPLGEESGYLIEGCLSLQVLGMEKMRGFLKTFVEQNRGVVALAAAAPPPPPAPAAPIPSQAPLPEAVDKILGGVKDLWSIPANTKKIQDMLATPETPVELVCADIERDPGLAAQCLRVVNSAAYGMSKMVGSVKHAVVLLGYGNARRIVTVSALISKLGQQHGDVPFDLKSFWGHSLWVAHAGSLVSKITEVGLPDDYFSGGLMHDIGKLVEYQYLRPQLKLILSGVQGGARFEDVEMRVLGVNHAVIGACVCDRWGFPKQVTDSVRYHLDSFATLEDRQLPREALVIAAMCSVGRKTLSAEGLDAWCGFLKITPKQVDQIGKEAAELSIASLRDIFVYS